MAKKNDMTEAEVREARLDKKLKALAEAGDWDGVLAEMDKPDMPGPLT